MTAMKTNLRDIISSPSSPPQEKIVIDKISRLKHSPFPNYIFGGGGSALKVANILINNNIPFVGFCEGKRYYQVGKKVLDKPVFLVDDIMITRHNLILGAGGGFDLQPTLQSIIESEKNSGNNIFSFYEAFDTWFQMSFTWVYEHIDALQKSYDLLADDLSRETFLSYINDRVHCITKNIRPLHELWLSNQYFNDLYPYQKFNTHALIDCGAYIGDTAEEYITFLRNAGYEGKVYAFEPDPDNYQKLLTIAKRINDVKNSTLECFPYAVGSKKKEVVFSAGNGSISHLSADDKGIKVCMMPIDTVMFGKHVSYLKMDLEGGEEDALNGAVNTIRDNNPMLSICVYHKIDDLINIPNCILSLLEGRNYKYYLRHHSSYFSETVFYAVPF